MRGCRIHFTGASGAGVTTLGRALADAFAAPHHDTDDYFWLPTQPPYTMKRPAADRLRLMQELFVPRAQWVLSGSLVGWAGEIERCFDAVIFVSTPTATRLDRLRRREELRHGAGSTSKGGSRCAEFSAFLAWAASYDDPAFSGRSKARHEDWLATLRCPVIKVDGTRSAKDIVADIMRL